MRTISIVLVAFLLLTLSSCKKTEEEAETLVVTARSGLNLRDKPHSSGARIATIPEGGIVTVLEKSSATEVVKGKEGIWKKVSWQGKTGYAFSIFLGPRVEAGRRPGCSPFMLYRVICLSPGEAEKIALRVLKDPAVETASVTADMFETPSPLIPGSEILVISREGVITERVRSLSINKNTRYPMITFELGRDYSESLYMSLADIRREGASEPETIQLSAVTEPGRGKELLGFILAEKKLPTSLESFFNQDTWSQDPAEIQKHYIVTVEEIKKTQPGVKYEIVTLLHREKDPFKNVIALFSNGKKDFADFGSINTVFEYGNRQYVALERWTPNTGDSSAHLYIMEDGRMKEIIRDDRFSN